MDRFLGGRVFMSLGCIYLRLELLGLPLKDFFKLRPRDIIRLKESILL